MRDKKISEQVGDLKYMNKLSSEIAQWCCSIPLDSYI